MSNSARITSIGGRGIGDQLDDDLMASEGPASPILGDAAEHPVLDLVPQSTSAAIAATAIGRDQGCRGATASLDPHFLHHQWMASLAKCAVP